MINSIRLTFLLILAMTSYAQVGSWENLPTLTEIRALIPLENNVLIASDGGVLVFDRADESFLYDVYGMQTNNLDVKAIYIDPDSLLWVGSKSPGPIIEVFDLKTNTRQQVEFVDLEEVNSFVQVGDSIYTTYQDGLEGGLLLFRIGTDKIEYLDQFNNFPDQNSLDLTAVGDVFTLNGKLIFRTNNHILYVELDGSNLKDPVNWKVIFAPNTGSDINQLIPYGDDLLLTLGDRLYRYNFSGFTELFSTGSPILDMREDPEIAGRLVLATQDDIYEYNVESGEDNQLVSQNGIQNIGVYEGEIWVGSSSDFLSVLSEQSYMTFSANRPSDHFFNQMMTNSKGELVGAAYNGISIHADEGWRTVRAGSENGSFDDDLYDWNKMIIDTLEYRGYAVVEDMITDHEGKFYLSIQGRGVLKFDSVEPDESAFYDATDGVLEPTFNSETFILPTQMASDSRNNIWLTTKFVREGGHVLTILGPAGEINHIDQDEGGLSSRTVKSIAIDENDLVWTGSQVRSELQALGGIHLIAPVEGADQPEWNVSALIGSPLASNEILQLEIDSQNTLWILTTSGVQSMTLPDTWLNSTELSNWANLHMTPKLNDYYYYWQLTDYNVTGIEIDQRGNHWFLSSNAGVHVLQDNGRWINGGFGYNTGNSDLIDNEIYSMAFDPQSGQAFFSTPKGISILKTAFAEPKENYSGIHIYPQPFKPANHDRVIIQGLMDNSSVKILTVSGMLVRELSSQDDTVQGYEAQWDGRDTAGDLVGSGVYILYLFNEDGVVSSQKLALLR